MFLLCGIWHGANWTFLLWGVWHGVFSLLESIHVIPVKKLEKTRVLGHIYTLFVVILGFVMFRATTVSQGFAMINTMFTGFRFTDAGTVALRTLLTGESCAMLLCGGALSIPVNKIKTSRSGLACAATLLLFVLCVIKLAAGDFSPSIYAGF